MSLVSLLVLACADPEVAAPPTIPTPTAPPAAEPGSSSPEPSSPASTPTTDSGTAPAPDEGPDWVIEDTVLYVNVGDSVAAGYDADGQYGYAKLLHENQDLLAPGYVGHDLVARSGATLRSVAESGATSGEILSNLRGADLPDADGPVVVTISAGGNDFNDDVAVMLSEALTRVVAAEVRANVAAMIDELRDRYDEVHIYVLDIQDPTDGTGSIPERYDGDLCGVIQATPGLLANLGVANLELLNDELALEAAEQGVELVPYHDHFLGHGLTSNDGWMSDDCAHPTTLGHHELRRVIWASWTGEWW